MSLLDEPRYHPIEAAKKLKMSRKTFDKKVKNGEIEVIRHSKRSIEVPKASLEKYLQNLLKAGAPKAAV